VNEWLLRETLWYDTFHWNCCIPEIPEIEKLRFLGVSRCKFKLRFWLNLNLYRVIWAAQFRGSRRNFSGNCPIMTLHAILCMTLVWDSIQFPQIQIEIWLNLSLYRVIWVARFGGFRGVAFSVEPVQSWLFMLFCAWLLCETLWQFPLKLLWVGFGQ